MVKRDKKLSLFFYPDIYNKLYIMIKQTWEVSNEERNRILSLHESATKNHYLVSEQISVKQNRGVDVIISSRDSKIIENLDAYDIKEWEKGTIRWDGKGYSKKIFNESVNEMKKMMDETSLQVFEKMKNENPKFYLYSIIKYMGPPGNSRGTPDGKGVFDNEYDYSGLFGYRRSTIKDKKIIVDDSVTIQEEITPPTEGGKVSGPVMEQGYTIITPPTVQQPTLFEFNEAVMTPEFIQYINQTIFGGIDEAIKKMSEELVKEGRKPAEVWVNKLKITSSSSTIPNGVSEKTFRGKIPTFKQLSDARAKVVYDYIVEGIKQRNGVINPEGIEIDSQGTNAGKQISVKSGNQTLKLDGTGTSGPEYNGQNREELKKYQRVDLTFDFAVKGTTPPPQSDPVETEPIPEELVPISQTDFIVRFSATGRKRLKVKIRVPQITLPDISLRGLFVKKGVLPCYYY
jgi:hypothetical protein